MADEVEVAINFLKVLSEASELAKILGYSTQLATAFPFVGAVLGLTKCFLPDIKHDEILRCFEKLSNQIDQVRDDIKDLEKMIKWEITQLQYGDVVGRIMLGMEFCVEIGKASGKTDKTRYQDRLKEVCANQNLTLALNALLDGMAGKGLFRKSILDNFYNETKGHRPKISSLATRLLQLVCGGMIVLVTYETVKRGKEGAEEMTQRYTSQLKDVYAKVQSVYDSCMKNFRDNMTKDIEEKLGKCGSNEGVVAEIKDVMRDKYDWLENFCLVYNDMQGFDKHCIGGHYVHSFRHKGKCGVVFYRMKDEPPKFSGRYDEAKKINNDVSCGNAQEGNNNIVAKLDQSGIGWSGCAVIRVGYDLKYAGTFSTKYVAVTGHNATAIILLK